MKSPLRHWKMGSLFTGIGGIDLGLERAGLGKTVWQVEQDAFCRSILEKHWPRAKRLEDVRKVTRSDVVPVDLLSGGFPCQPSSLAGRRRAQKDERWLWPEFARLIGELSPKVVVAENVLGLRTAGLRDVLSDLATLGFDIEWTTLAAGEIGAPHLRQRIFIVATHPHRVHVRHEPGWLDRACRAAFAPLPGDHVEGGGAPHAGRREVGELRQAQDGRSLWLPGLGADPHERASSDTHGERCAPEQSRGTGPLGAGSGDATDAHRKPGPEELAWRSASPGTGGGAPSDAREEQPLCGEEWPDALLRRNLLEGDEERDAADADGGPGWRDVQEGQPEALDAGEGAPAHADSLRRLEQARRIADERGWSRLCGWRLDSIAALDDGLPGGLAEVEGKDALLAGKRNVGKKRKALGNAVVVPVLEVIGRAIVDAVGDLEERKVAAT